MSIGYENTPIIKVISFLVLILTFFSSSSYLSFSFDINKIIHGEIYRIISCHFIFSSMGSAFVGLLLLYSCRHFERQLGSRKFGSFVFLSLLLSTLIQLGLVVMALSVGYDNLLPSTGPYFLIFSLLPFFYKYVPKVGTPQYSILGLIISEKSWTYLLASQLVLGESTSSIVAAVSGLVAGYLYIQDHTKKLQKFRLPKLIENNIAMIGAFFSSLVPAPITQPSRDLQNHLQQQQHQQQQHQQQQQQLGRNNRFADAFNEGLGNYGGFGQPTISEQDVETLMGLGFERNAVIRALESANGDTQAAANILLR